MTRILPTHLELEEKERIELDYWRESAVERDGADGLDNFFNKLGDSRRLRGSIEAHRRYFEGATDILEIGGGQGWASCLVRKQFPAARVSLSDLSEDAVRAHPTWERVFGVRLERAFACRSYSIPAADGSYDLVFCFAAAHHFIAHRRTLAEIRRVLRRGGACLYLYEPTCADWIYPLAIRRVNAIREDLPEDVLRTGMLTRLAESEGFQVTTRVDFDPAGRGLMKRAYYQMLRACPPLQALLPCVRDFVLVRSTSPG